MAVKLIVCYHNNLGHNFFMKAIFVWIMINIKRKEPDSTSAGIKYYNKFYTTKLT